MLAFIAKLVFCRDISLVDHFKSPLPPLHEWGLSEEFRHASVGVSLLVPPHFPWYNQGTLRPWLAVTAVHA